VTGATRRAVLAAAALAVLVAPEVARAYAFLYVPGSQGVPRRWNLGAFEGGGVPWVLSSVVGQNVTGDRAPLDVVSAAFAAWQAVDSSAIGFSFRGTVAQRNRDSRDRVNLFALGSQESLGTGVLAATFLTSNDAGELLDVDIVFSGNVPFSTSGASDPGRYDLQSVATHEVGHLLGLEHTGLSRATMAPFTDRADVHQRSVARDDATGATVLYPAGGVLGTTGALAGRVTQRGGAVYLAHVVAATANGAVVATSFTRPDGSYRIEGLPPDVYFVYAEPLDGPVVPGNLTGLRSAFGEDPTSGYGTFFH
jgi:hypothetical protein